jgi:glycosyltransferase involved in cell wall biosynthesis
VRGYTGTDVDGYRSFLRESQFDVVMNYAAQEWTADLFFDVIDDVDAKKVFVPCGFSALHDPRYADYFARMPSIMQRYDANVFLAEHYRDVDFARDHGVSNGRLIPNGAAAEEFEELSEKEAAEFRQRHGIEGLLVTTLGNHTGAKGHGEAIRAFMRARTGPATLLILGGFAGGGCLRRCRGKATASNLAARATGKRIVLLHPPRSETVAALKASDVFLFLSNLECSPIVLFEAAAAGAPFVASPAGNASEIARWTGGGVVTDAETRPDGLVLPSVRSAAAHLAALAADPERRRSLGEAGREAWRRQFTWGAIAGEYLDLYEQLLRG